METGGRLDERRKQHLVEAIRFRTVSASAQSNLKIQMHLVTDAHWGIRSDAAVILVIVVGTIRLVGSNANTVFSQAASSIQ